MRILFLMTPGINLSTWRENGSYSREIKMCLAYAEAGWDVDLVSFGPEKYDFTEIHENISIVNVKYSKARTFLYPISLFSYFKAADVVKTNQSYYSWVFVLAAKLAATPILLRCGYVYGEYLQSVRGLTVLTRIYKVLEGWAFRNATFSVVTTHALLNWIELNYGVSRDKVAVIPNFVDTDLFRPTGGPKIRNSVITIGRLDVVKRLDLLIMACARIEDCHLTIVGEGPERKRLQNLSQKMGVRVEMPGSLPHSGLPELLCRHQVFALTSLREGHPKALIEAMACGLACVGSFQGQDNFYDAILTTSPSAVEISYEISRLFNSPTKLSHYSKRARDFAQKEYNFGAVFRTERALLVAIAKIR